jgi:peroxiredoxin
MSVQVGQQAPAFTLRDQHGQQVTLSAFRGAKVVLVVFYPFVFSKTCTAELCELRDAGLEQSNDKVALLAISCDPIHSLRTFADEASLSYPLLSDFWPHGAVARAYGVFNEAVGCAFRGTFLVRMDGSVGWKVDNGMPDARSIDDYRAALARV